MKGEQIFFIAVTFGVILLVTLLAQFRWLPDGTPKRVILFLAGVIAIVSLRLADIPPDWFSGSKRGFLLALGFLLSGWVAKAGEARAFGLPLFLGMGLTLIAVNLLRLLT